MMIRENKQFKLWLSARAIKLKRLEDMILNDLSDESDHQDLSDSADLIDSLDRDLENYIADLGKLIIVITYCFTIVLDFRP